MPNSPISKAIQSILCGGGAGARAKEGIGTGLPRLSEEGGSICVLTEALVPLSTFRGLLRGQ